MGTAGVSSEPHTTVREPCSKGWAMRMSLPSGVYIFYHRIYFVGLSEFLERYECVRKCKEFGQWVVLLQGRGSKPETQASS